VRAHGAQLIGVVAIPAGIELVHIIAHPACAIAKALRASPDDLVYLAVGLQLHEVADIVVPLVKHGAKKKPLPVISRWDFFFITTSVLVWAY
jgi:hypothetical protein